MGSVAPQVVRARQSTPLKPTAPVAPRPQSKARRESFLAMAPSSCRDYLSDLWWISRRRCKNMATSGETEVKCT